MQKLFIAIFFTSISFLFGYSLVLAQTATPAPTLKNPVTFHVEIGSLVCKNGIGASSVLFLTDPKTGGHFEIFGGSINQNLITLDRRVVLKSGTYTWKGIVNEGYREVPPSIGEFTVPVCNASSPKVVSPVSAPKKQPSSIVKSPEKVTVENKEDVIETAPTDTAGTGTVSLLGTEENDASETNQPKTVKVIIFGFIIFWIAVGVLSLKNSNKKTKE